ncbi:EAL domain-containing protein [Rathayibacter sp. YIM 133350]|uniref:EAL domain-containing protein n=1 Tax=Rathayibacter sp. YIM 133350 TaxID=3131992 RepID=UPI00307E7D82
MSSTEATTEERLRRDLAVAVDLGQIVARYQPQVDLATGAFVAVESLSRWQHPELGLVPPDVFIPLAEATGAIHDIGRFMLADACRLAADWDAQGLAIEVSVNVSARQLDDDRFFGDLEGYVGHAGIEAGRLTIEITESERIDDLEAVSERLSQVRGTGVGISIDDFGTGHTSVEQLMSLPASELKIDRTIVQDDSAIGNRMLATVIGLVKDRGIRVVAEGVETPADLQRARRLRCDRAQGYLIARPLPRVEVEALLLENRQ